MTHTHQFSPHSQFLVQQLLDSMQAALADMAVPLFSHGVLRASHLVTFRKVGGPGSCMGDG